MTIQFPTRLPRRHRYRHHSGFTLVELLIVIGIIALLAALLFPVVKSAQNRAKTTSCSSNLRQWAIAMVNYLPDNDGKFPTEGALGAQVQPGNASAWFNVLAKDVGEKSLYDRALNFEPMPRPGEQSLYFCPSVSYGDIADFGITSVTEPFMCYSYNLWIDHSVGARESDNSAAGYGSQTIFPELLSISHIQNPSEFAIFSEIQSQAGNCIPKFLTYRHGVGEPDSATRTVNIAFADGHVGTFKKEDIYTTIKAENRGGVVWNPEPAAIEAMRNDS